MIHKNSATRIVLIAILVMTLVVPATSIDAQPNQMPRYGFWAVLCTWGQDVIWNGSLSAPGVVVFDLAWTKVTGESGINHYSYFLLQGGATITFHVKTYARINWLNATGFIIWDWAFCGGVPASPPSSANSAKAPPISITVEQVK